MVVAFFITSAKLRNIWERNGKQPEKVLFLSIILEDKRKIRIFAALN